MREVASSLKGCVILFPTNSEQYLVLNHILNSLILCLQKPLLIIRATEKGIQNNIKFCQIKSNCSNIKFLIVQLSNSNVVFCPSRKESRPFLMKWTLTRLHCYSLSLVWTFCSGNYFILMYFLISF